MKNNPWYSSRFLRVALAVLSCLLLVVAGVELWSDSPVSWRYMTPILLGMAACALQLENVRRRNQR